MNYKEAVKAGIIPLPDPEMEWEMKRTTLNRFTSEELLRELKDRANRKVIDINNRLKKKDR